MSSRHDRPSRRAVASPPPTTPDGRYFVVRGRLWRRANPALPEDVRTALVAGLMNARRAIHKARLDNEPDAEHLARQRVDAAKHALGERGPVWWQDGSPDYNRHMARNTPYAAWFAGLDDHQAAAADPPKGRTGAGKARKPDSDGKKP